MYQNVQLFVGSVFFILNIAMFKYSFHKFRETVLHQKYQLIQARRSIITHNSSKCTTNANYIRQAFIFVSDDCMM